MMDNQEIFKIVAKAKLKELKEVINEGSSLDIHSPYPPHESLLQISVAEEEAKTKYLEITKAIIETGVDVDKWDLQEENNPILTASRFFNKRAIKLLLKHGADCNVFSSDGISPILIFVKKGDCKMVRILLDYGGNKSINKGGGISGMNALGLAVFNCDVEMIKLLMTYGADPNFPDLAYMIPLQRLPLEVHESMEQEIREILAK